MGGYNYQAERPFVFTEEGQVMFLKIRDTAKLLLDKSGAVSCARLISGCTGSSWSMLACVDRLVELRELAEVPNPYSSAGLDRLFIAGSRP